MLFVSYSRADRDAVEPFVADVRALGHEVWLDEDLAGGQVWWDEILSRIRACDALLFAVSPASVVSEACLLELDYAEALRRGIIPVELAATDPDGMPSVLGRHQTVRYGTGDKAAMIALARALARPDLTGPLPDPEPPQPPLPGSYFRTLREQVRSADGMDLDQQVGILHRLQARADDDAARGEIVTLLEAFRDRDDVYASVAEQIDAMSASLTQLDRPGHAPRATDESRRPNGPFRRPAGLVDGMVIALAAAAAILGLLGLGDPLFSVDDSTFKWGDWSELPARWQLGAILLVFAATVVASFVVYRGVRPAASVVALVSTALGLLFWWWPAIGDLLDETVIATGSGPISLGPGLVGSGISLVLQLVVAALMFGAAFTVSRHAGTAD